MVSETWQALHDELARWRDAGRTVDFWWRDDDATHWTPALERLVDLAQAMDVPIALAVVPATADRALFSRLHERHEDVVVLQHGVDHRNRGGDAVDGAHGAHGAHGANAAESTKRTEFAPTEPGNDALVRIAAGRARLATLAGARMLAVLAPPWNRLPPTLAARLPEAGMHGLSTFGARPSAGRAPGITQVNTHVDLVAWRDGRGFVGTQAALNQALRHLVARRTGRADPGEPTGWLSHHLQHDEAAWGFIAELLEATRQNPAVRWHSARALFAPPAG